MNGWTSAWTPRPARVGRRRRRALEAAGIALVLGVLGVLGIVGSLPASAHTALASSDPRDGQTLPVAPSQVGLTFTQDIATVGVTVLVTGPSGAVVAGAPAVTGASVTQPLQPGLAAGAYQVRWQVTARDGHPISGSLAFTVAAPTASAAASATPVPPPDPTASAPSAVAKPAPTAAGGTATSDDGNDGLVTAAIGVGVIALVAAAVAGAVVGRRRSSG